MGKTKENLTWELEGIWASVVLCCVQLSVDIISQGRMSRQQV